MRGWCLRWIEQCRCWLGTNATRIGASQPAFYDARVLVVACKIRSLLHALGAANEPLEGRLDGN